MNDEQIDQAARKLCELRGINPDQLVGHGADPDPDGSVPCVYLQSPAWKLVRREVMAHWQLQQAIEATLAASEGDGDA